MSWWTLQASARTHLWDGSDPNWVVLSISDTDDDAGSPYNRRAGMVELICDDLLAAAVLRTMRSHGVPTVQIDALGDQAAGNQFL